MTLLGGERPSRRSLAVPIREIFEWRVARDEARTVVRASPPGRPHLEGDNEHSIPAERAECKWRRPMAVVTCTFRPVTARYRASQL